MINYLIKFYLIWRNICCYLKYFIYSITGNIHLVYVYYGLSKINITPYVYFDIPLKYLNVDGKFVYHIHSKNHEDNIDIVINGNIKDVKKYIKKFDEYKKKLDNIVKRKNITVMNNDDIIDFNFQLLDKQYILIQHHNEEIPFDSNLKTLISTLSNNECSHINITKIFPYNKETHDIDNVTIHMIYE